MKFTIHGATWDVPAGATITIGDNGAVAVTFGAPEKVKDLPGEWGVKEAALEAFIGKMADAAEAPQYVSDTVENLPYGYVKKQCEALWLSAKRIRPNSRLKRMEGVVKAHSKGTVRRAFQRLGITATINKTDKPFHWKVHKEFF